MTQDAASRAAEKMKGACECNGCQCQAIERAKVIRAEYAELVSAAKDVLSDLRDRNPSKAALIKALKAVEGV